MFRNQYDSDVTVWSPQGRLHQVEYAMEAVKLGLATVGLKSKTHALLVAFKKAPSELSSYQKKMFSVDNHIGISIAGITADARILCRYLRQECMGHTFTFNEPYPVSRIVANLGNKIQVSTQRYDRRPYGVGLLIAGFDDNGPHIYQVDPSANFFNCKAMSIGSRSQSAKTYLEKNLDQFQLADIDRLIQHGLNALSGTLGDKTLSSENVSIGYVSKGEDFKILSLEENEFHINAFKSTQPEQGGSATGPVGPDPAPGPSGAGGIADEPADDTPRED